MTRLLKRVRRSAGATKRWLTPSAELAAWRRACRLAERTPRHTPGRVRLGPYTLQYPDLLTVCPQWRDIFVDGSLTFRSATLRPRILDCGANIGLASLFFKQLYPGARITAFEADPAIAAMLAANLRENGASDVQTVAAAVWTTNGDVDFDADGADAGSIRFGSAHRGAAPLRVPARRLRDVIDDEPIDLLKLDIEGAEADVLDDSFDRLANVRALLVEVHEVRPDRRQSSRVLDLLDRAGFAYALTHVTPLPWRQPPGADSGPFPQSSLAWVAAVRAWRPAIA